MAIKKLKLKRLKIVEQIMIVLVLSVVVPFIISGLIINNINQHAIRHQLSDSALMIANIVANNIEDSYQSEMTKLNDIAIGLKYLDDRDREFYLNEALFNNEDFKEFKLISVKDGEKVKNTYLDEQTNKFYVSTKVKDNLYLVAIVNKEAIKKNLFKIIENDNRAVYLVSNNLKFYIGKNYNEKEFNRVIQNLPENIEPDKAQVFGKKKNQPLVYFKLSKLPVIVIVNTTEALTNETIYESRFRIIAIFLITALVIFLIVGFYTAYLYINIRQLFKAVIALSKGNYKRQIRLLKNIFTPHEIVFLSHEFNKMAEEINSSYKKLKQKNHELKLLDGFRSNLIDTISHEFRTPLTSIRGYSSRLLRNDIVIDEETQIKSLKIIKKQSERLSRMVEDLLVIPDIEGARLNIKFTQSNLVEILEVVILSVNTNEEKEIILNNQCTSTEIYTDKDRLEQILINLLENAVKYSYENTNIEFNVSETENEFKFEVINQADYIEPEILNKLYEKFTRIDDKTTRTTRGTGLGLYIVKGLVKAINGKIKTTSTKENIYKTVITLKKDQ